VIIATEEPDVTPLPSEGDFSHDELSAEDIPWEEEIDISFDDDNVSADRSLTTDGEAPAPALLLNEGGVHLLEEDEETISFDEPASEEAHEVEVELADFPGVTDDWLSGTGHDFVDQPAEASAGEDLSFDFTEEDLDEIIPSPHREKPAPKSDKYGLDGLFSAFKKGVGEQLDQDDTESHYSLGIAYKEMGLFDDAIAEFQAAARDPRRLADCITLQGICSREKGDLVRAEEFFRAGLGLSDLSAVERLCLTYELALLHELVGQGDRALAAYREIFALNPAFRDTAQKIAQLQCDVDALESADIELVDLDEVEEGAG
jgi:tetratricopeptide (TPR) repeat protein